MFFTATQEISVLRHREPMIAQAIVALQRRAYKVEADLLDFPALPPLQESPAVIMASREIFYGLTSRTGLLAMLATESMPDRVVISRLCVSPSSTRRGYATRLIRHILGHTEQPILVTTGAANEPALMLYRGMGFTDFEQHETVEGLKLITLRYLPHRASVSGSHGD
jgi:ribosomal protein S18 acetylase RimI-like enzyme